MTLRALVIASLVVLLPSAALPQEVTRAPGAVDDASVTVELRAEHGERVTNATVALSGPWEMLLEPDGHGRYRVEGVRPGRYALVVTALGYQTVRQELEVTPGDALFHRAVLAADPLELPGLLARGVPGEDATLAGHAVSRVDFTEQAVAYRSIAEWLALQPGVTTRQFGPGGRQVVGVRGSRSEAVLVLLDGVPINDPLTGAADLSAIPVSSLQSASLVRGTSSARYGPGASAGVLLLRSRAPSGPVWTAGVELGSLAFRAADLHLTTGGALGQAGLFVRAEAADNDFWYLNRTIPGVPRERRRNTDMSSLHSELSIQAAGLPLSARFRFDDRERGVPGRIGTNLFDGARWADRSFQTAVQLGWQRHGSLTGGFRLQRLRYEPGDARDPTVSRLSTLDLAGSTPPLGLLGIELLGRIEREAVAGDEVVGAPERWAAGLAGTRPFGSVAVVVQPSLAFDLAPQQSSWSPELAVTARPRRNLEAWARVGRGFRLPSFSDLYFASAYRIRPNPDLIGETISFDGELGARWGAEPGQVLDVQLVAFRRVTDDPIVWLASAAAVWSPQNLDRLEASGLEMAAYIRSPDGRLRLGGEATYTDSRLGFADNRNPLPYQPAWSGSAVLEGSTSVWAGRLEMRYTGPRTTGVAATRRLPGYVSVDLTGRTEVRFGALTLSVQGRVLNLFDRRYEYVELFPEPGRRLEIRLEGS